MQEVDINRRLSRQNESSGARRFVILTVPRTGSKLLSEMLDSHPDILCHTEIYNPKSTYLSRKPHLKIGSKTDRDQNPWQFLKAIYAASDGKNLVGFKIMPNHQNRIMLGTMFSRSIMKIVLTRDNWLDTYVSNKIALSTRQFHIATDSKPDPVLSTKPVQQVYVDLKQFKVYLRKIQIYYRSIKAIETISFQQFHWIDYTDLKDPHKLAGLLRFLEVDQNVLLEERLQKQNKGCLSQKISNYREIAHLLKGTRMERFLTE